MDKIELNPLDKKDLLEVLDYAINQKEINRPVRVTKRGKTKWDDTTYWIMRIKQLKKVINGYSTEGSYIQSSMTTIDFEPKQKEKEKMRYRNNLERDISNVFDSKNEK